jgi:hypothetical protein
MVSNKSQLATQLRHLATNNIVDKTTPFSIIFLRPIDMCQHEQESQEC